MLENRAFKELMMNDRALVETKSDDVPLVMRVTGSRLDASGEKGSSESLVSNEAKLGICEMKGTIFYIEICLWQLRKLPNGNTLFTKSRNKTSNIIGSSIYLFITRL